METFYCNKTVPGIIWALEIFLVNVIKFIAFHMNPRLTKITLSCQVFFIDIYKANFAEVNYTIHIYKNAH